MSSDNLQPKLEDKPEEDKLNGHWLNGYWCTDKGISLDTLQSAKIPQEEKKMFNDDDDDFEGNAAVKFQKETRDWFLSELDNATDVHRAKISRHFNMANDNYPETANEFVKRIQDGKFVIKDGDSPEFFSVYNLPRFIEFRDPSLIPDPVGYGKALEDLNTARRKVVRNIMGSSWTGDYAHSIEKFEKLNFLPPTLVPVPANDVAKVAIAA